VLVLPANHADYLALYEEKADINKFNAKDLPNGLVVKFTDKERHQIFLEPEGYDTNEVYPNGLSTRIKDNLQQEAI